MLEPLALDDLTYDDLVAQARALIPVLCPEWTDHNPSDPGIAMIELLAWLCEMVVYRTNRVPEASYRAFLHVLAPPGSARADEQLPLDEAVRNTIAQLRTLERAVTPNDFATLILEQHHEVKRVRCVPSYNLIPKSPGFIIGRTSIVGRRPTGVSQATGYMGIVVMTGDPGNNYQPGANLLAEVTDFIRPRCLLTTKATVVGPRVLALTVDAVLHLAGDGTRGGVEPLVKQALDAWLDPLGGGPDGTGWPFGRRIHGSDIYRILDGIPGLDFVDGIQLTALGQTQDEGVDMDAYELARVTRLNLRFFQPVQGGWREITP